MSKAKYPSVPTEFLPKEWRAKGAEKFNKSKSLVEKVVYGFSKNDEILAYMTELAEEGKREKDELLKKLNELSQK